MNEEDTVGEKRVGEKKRQKRKIRDEDEKGSKGNGEWEMRSKEHRWKQEMI